MPYKKALDHSDPKSSMWQLENVCKLFSKPEATCLEFRVSSGVINTFVKGGKCVRESTRREYCGRTESDEEFLSSSSILLNIMKSLFNFKRDENRKSKIDFKSCGL